MPTIRYQQGIGGLFLIANDETFPSFTTSQSPAKTLAIPANSYRFILLEVELELDGGGNETENISAIFSPHAGAQQVIRLKTVGHVAADTNILTTRGSTIYTQTTAHNAVVNTTVISLGVNGAYSVGPFRAWGIP